MFLVPAFTFKYPVLPKNSNAVVFTFELSTNKSTPGASGDACATNTLAVVLVGEGVLVSSSSLHAVKPKEMVDKSMLYTASLFKFAIVLKFIIVCLMFNFV